MVKTKKQQKTKTKVEHTDDHCLQCGKEIHDGGVGIEQGDDLQHIYRGEHVNMWENYEDDYTIISFPGVSITLPSEDIVGIMEDLIAIGEMLKQNNFFSQECYNKYVKEKEKKKK